MQLASFLSQVSSLIACSRERKVGLSPFWWHKAEALRYANFSSGWTMKSKRGVMPKLTIHSVSHKDSFPPAQLLPSTALSLHSPFLSLHESYSKGLWRFSNPLPVASQRKWLSSLGLRSPGMEPPQLWETKCSTERARKVLLNLNLDL